MLIYVTSTQNNGIFDFLNTKATGMPIKKFIGDYELSAFVDNDLSKFPSYRYLAVDLECIMDMPEGLFKAVEAINDWFELRLIIFAREIKPELKQELINREVYNIITGDPREYEELIKKAVSRNGITYQDHLLKDEIHDVVAIEQPPIAEVIRKPSMEETITIDELPLQEVINEEGERVERFICVAGSQRRTGTTTTAIQLANYLANQGKMVAYIEVNDHHHLKSIIEAYRMKKEEIEDGEWYQTKGVDYFYQDGTLMKTYDYIIGDIGVLSEDVIDVFETGDIKILCGAGKCFERNALNAVLELNRDHSIEDANLILNFIAPEEQMILNGFFPAAQFTGYTPNLMGWSVNKELFKSLLKINE
ncbi:hypothetical protein [Acetobacterium bakii]|uniref:CobQ/CobB/MinD/ParA nucleotide binding domain-containing protein n=1 Tax=Acetobacterium bakii TaxID=52689 RepID=A0A0L6U1P3_9FIRM|nr:hypothetical protein [Acetobacterium bakii]KNZ42424.1 hypothetical protein AKG39_06580 [Acetobacterium bakii]